MATIDEVRRVFVENRDAIGELDAQLGARRKAIKMNAFRDDRRMTAEEIAERKQIGATRAELAEALQELALGTLDALNRASDIDPLIKEIAAISDELSDDLDHLRSIEEFAEKAAKVASVLVKVGEKLLKLKSVLPI